MRGGVNLRDLWWQNLLHRAKTGDHPRRSELAEILSRALEDYDVPAEARTYIAELIRDEHRLREGRPPMGSMLRWEYAVHLGQQTRWLEAAFRLEEERAPRSRALQIVAGWCGLKPDTVKRKISRDLRGAPDWIRERIHTQEEAEAQAREWRAEGAKLDPTEGIIFPE